MSSFATDGARPAAVIPRAHRMRSKASLPIDQLVLPIIRSRVTGLVWISAPPGGGKTTALQHLKAVLPTNAPVGFFECHQSQEAKAAAASGLALLAASEPLLDRHTLDAFQLSPWTMDDCMEYLLFRYRPRCRSVLDRLRQDGSFAVLLGAIVKRTDFYLVDLRQAVFSSSQARHFARTGAILTDRPEGK